MDPIVPKPGQLQGIPLPWLLLAAAVMAVLPCTLPRWRVANGHLGDRSQAPPIPEGAGLIQSVSQALLPLLSAWVEVGGIASSLCLTALLLQPISI